MYSMIILESRENIRVLLADIRSRNHLIKVRLQIKNLFYFHLNFDFYKRDAK